MENWKIRQTVDLARSGPSLRVWPDALMVEGDNEAHTWEITVMENGKPANLDGVTCLVHFLREREGQDEDVVCKGSVSGNVASVVLKQECYVEGQAIGIFRLVIGESKLTLSKLLFTIGKGPTGVVIDPGSAVGSLDDLIAKIDAIETATADGRAQQEQVAQAESSRVSAEQTRITAEQSRVTAEQERASSESSRASAEQARGAAEQNRAAAEQGRITAEISRASAEQSRVNAEQSRVNAEQERVTAESSRVSAETERMAAETARTEAEAQRAQTFAGYQGEIGSLKDDLFESKTITGTCIDIEGAKLSIVADKPSFIGCKNHLRLNDCTITSNGVTFTVKDNLISIDGTTESDGLEAWIPLEKPVKVKSGFDYVISKCNIIGTASSYINCVMENEQKGVCISGSKLNLSPSDSTYYKTASATYDSNICYLHFSALGNKTYNLKLNLQLEIGTESTDYIDSYGSEYVEANTICEAVNPSVRVNSLEITVVNYYVNKKISYNDLTKKPSINGILLDGDIKLNERNVIENKQNPFEKDLNMVTFSNYTQNSLIANGTSYLSYTKDSINDLFYYSVPMKKNPNYDAVMVDIPINLSYFVEFICNGDFEFSAWGGNATFALMIDGKDVVGTDMKITEDGQRYIKVSFNDGIAQKHTVRIYLQKSFAGVVSEYPIEKTNHPRPRVITDGDSIVEGVSKCGVTYGQVVCWASVMSRMLDLDLYNTGCGGSGYIKAGTMGNPSMNDRFDTYIAPYNPDILVVSAGLNDSDKTIDEIKSAVTTYWNHAKEALSTKYLICVSPYSPSNAPSETVLEFFDAIRDTVLEIGDIPYIDIVRGVTYDSMGNIISQYRDGGINTEERRHEWYADYYAGETTDGTHPMICGHQYIGKYIANEIYKICKNDFGVMY